jgi:hypothetical protein
VDLTGDGALDLLVSCDSVAGPFLRVLRNMGQGTFTPATVPSLQSQSVVVVAVSDMNGDSRPDVVSAYLYGGASVVLNEGQGVFAPAVMVGPYGQIAVGDLNGDGWQDLAVSYGSTPQIVLNQGNGTFGPPIPSAVSAVYSSSLAMGDLNGDHHTDIAFVDVQGNVGVLMNAGDGVTFTATALDAVGPGASSVAVGDLDGDRKLDLVVTRDPGYGGKVSVLLGNGDGTFAGPVDYDVGSNPVSPILADLNGDGTLDVVLTYREGDTVSVLLSTCRP